MGTGDQGQATYWPPTEQERWPRGAHADLYLESTTRRRRDQANHGTNIEG